VDSIRKTVEAIISILFAVIETKMQANLSSQAVCESVALDRLAICEAREGLAALETLLAGRMAGKKGEWRVEVHRRGRDLIEGAAYRAGVALPIGFFDI